MLLGVGTDIVEVERISRALTRERSGVRFRKTVFTEREIAYCEGHRHGEQSFAVRFAAKEAVMKVLGRGFFDGGIGWREIEVLRESGPPRLILYGRALERAAAIGAVRWHVSLSHTRQHAVAFVAAEGVHRP